MSAFSGVDTSRLLIEGMKVASRNHQMIANNIANVDTPNYNPVTMDFQATLRAALDGHGGVSLRKTHPAHLGQTRIRPRLEQVALLSKNDYNKVDLDTEMMNLSENTGKYTTYGSLLVKRFEVVNDMLANLR